MRVVHSADLGAPADLAPLLEKPVDLLVCGLAHFRSADLFRFLQGKPVRRMVLVHVDRRRWTQRERTRLLGKKMLGGIRFGFARGGEEIHL